MYFRILESFKKYKYVTYCVSMQKLLQVIKIGFVLFAMIASVSCTWPGSEFAMLEGMGSPFSHHLGMPNPFSFPCPPFPCPPMPCPPVFCPPPFPVCRPPPLCLPPCPPFPCAPFQHQSRRFCPPFPCPPMPCPPMPYCAPGTLL